MFLAIRNFIVFSIRWLTSPGWTLRRLLIVAAFYTVFPLLEITVWTGLLLDGILFRGYRREPVSSPVFIIGNPRSGTTFLHRLLSRDVERFTTMQMWEILFAPSIVQRKIFRALSSMVNRTEKSPGMKLARIENKWYQKNGMHEISFTKPEEDDYLLLHVWSALTIGLSAGLIQEALPYTYFDQNLHISDQKRILFFYKACLKRHLHVDRLRCKAKPKTYLAKNPALCPKIQSIKEEFPDAKFIYLVRSPLEMVPSYISMMQHSWDLLGIRNQEEELREYIIEMAKHWYRYPVERLDAFKKDHLIVRYEDLIQNPEKTVRRIYRQFQFHIGPVFEEALLNESAKARQYRSRHGYDIAGTGLSRGRVLSEFSDVFELFGYDKPSFNPEVSET